MTCVFCDIVSGDAPATIVRDNMHTLAIVPLNPVTPGHLLVIPKVHVADVGASIQTSAVTMRDAARLAARMESCNIITSMGAAATQTIYHLHLHVVPRRQGDGLKLPWTDQ